MRCGRCASGPVLSFKRGSFAFLNWLSCSWVTALACIQHVFRSEATFLRTPKEGKERSIWAALNGARVETALAVALWGAGAAISRDRTCHRVPRRPVRVAGARLRVRADHVVAERPVGTVGRAAGATESPTASVRCWASARRRMPERPRSSSWSRVCSPSVGASPSIRTHVATCSSGPKADGPDVSPLSALGDTITEGIRRVRAVVITGAGCDRCARHDRRAGHARGESGADDGCDRGAGGDGRADALLPRTRPRPRRRRRRERRSPTRPHRRPARSVARLCVEGLRVRPEHA